MKNIIAIVLAAFLLAGAVTYFDAYKQKLTPVTPEPPIQAGVPDQPKEETTEQKMKRWDRGEFTPEEKAELKEEEKREDRVVNTVPN